MTAKENKFLSIRIARFFMKVVGLWPAKSKIEERVFKGIIGYTIWTVILAIWIEMTELYMGRGDFYAITYAACSTMPVVITLLKICFFLSNKEEMLRMLRYTENNFWYADYDEYGTELLERINKKGIILITSFTFFVQGTVVTYMMAPIIGILIYIVFLVENRTRMVQILIQALSIFVRGVNEQTDFSLMLRYFCYVSIENLGRNESDRILVFKVWIGVPTNVSPNFEIVFVIEILVLIHMGVCFCCFDNLLGLLNIHTAGQFKILQHRLKTILDRIEQADAINSLNEKDKRKAYEEIKRCIIFHHELIWYSEKMEYIFMYTTLCQLLVSSVMICVAGFQVLLAQGTLVRRLIFIAHTNGCFMQLFLVTFTANELLDESRAVGDAAYSANWEVLSHEDNRGVRSAVLLIITRSMRACSISAGGFFPVSLETFMAVLSTAASYFTLLRNFIAE